MYKDELSIFIPNSFLSESKDLKIRTYKVGILGRALAIFKADNVVIYNDNQIFIRKLRKTFQHCVLKPSYRNFNIPNKLNVTRIGLLFKKRNQLFSFFLSFYICFKVLKFPSGGSL